MPATEHSMSVAVSVQGLEKSYPVGGWWRRGVPKRVCALRGVDLEVRRGEVFGIVGRNGYGKTTLIKCVASLLEPTAGTVQVLDLDTRRDGPRLRRRVGWVGADDRSFYYRLTGRQNLEFFGQLQGLDLAEVRTRTARLAAQLELERLVDRRFHEYSTGNRQRLAVARALLHEPELLILDEPTRSLDPFAARGLWRLLREWIRADGRRAILITSHNLPEVEEVSDRVGILGGGRLRACGPVDELRRTLGVNESVGLYLSADPVGAGVGAAPDRRWEPGAEPDVPGAGWLRISHRPGDDILDRVLRELVAAGIQVRAVRHEALTLQDVVDRMQGGGDGDD